MTEITEIDAVGLLCPLPVLKLRKRMMPLASGDQIVLIADDPASIVDVPHFCNEQGHELIDRREDGARIFFTVQKG
ncbi:sulfurtransferase TusA family protein [Cognatishimia activa]|uniref:Sulfurtransferase TusA n=1 Tax=Cognatishimia activa TaxID=1715691 RepID=A0A0P1INR9_9RHOB|nr:sulfurtransferase TusA family protein [Cognatishimia activa]MEE2944379.1 sulfurtransferase TusA family protein [Pseudomonadota bacterium]CUJ26422.1 Sulfurtransferase TusA [Cognatishimia activa]CUK25308.1 Sulfurtransferase TusA [Cognatishimia activa]